MCMVTALWQNWPEGHRADLVELQDVITDDGVLSTLDGDGHCSATHCQQDMLCLQYE